MDEFYVIHVLLSSNHSSQVLFRPPVPVDLVLHVLRLVLSLVVVIQQSYYSNNNILLGT